MTVRLSWRQLGFTATCLLTLAATATGCASAGSNPSVPHSSGATTTGVATTASSGSAASGSAATTTNTPVTATDGQGDINLRYGQDLLASPIAGHWSEKHGDAQKPVAMTLTVNSVTKGDSSDIDPVKFGEIARGMVPYYVNFRITDRDTMTGELPRLVGAAMAQSMKALFSDKTAVTEVATPDGFLPCPHTWVPTNFSKGMSVSICKIFLAPPGANVTGAGFPDYDDALVTQQSSRPIIWKS